MIYTNNCVNVDIALICCWLWILVYSDPIIKIVFIIPEGHFMQFMDTQGGGACALLYRMYIMLRSRDGF